MEGSAHPRYPYQVWQPLRIQNEKERVDKQHTMVDHDRQKYDNDSAKVGTEAPRILRREGTNSSNLTSWGNVNRRPGPRPSSCFEIMFNAAGIVLLCSS